MNWKIEFIPDALDDLRKLDHSMRIQVIKGIQKVSRNPLPAYQSSYGKPLGHKKGTNLTNLLKIKFKHLGIRVVYKVEIIDGIMKIIIISARTDEQVYKEAQKRKKKLHI